MKREMVRKAGLIVLSTLLAFVCAELLVRWLVVVRDVGPAFTVHDDVLGKRLKPGLQDVRISPEFRMSISINSAGFRGPEIPTGNRRSILFLGDSFTLGYGVSDGEEYPALVRAELIRRREDKAPAVINAGVGNSGNGFWVKLLRSKGGELNPEIVVMQVFDNDFEDNRREGLFSIAPDERLQEHEVPAPGFMRRVQAVVEAVPGLSHSYIVGLIRQALERPGRAAGGGAAATQTARQPQDELTLRIVMEALTVTRATGARAIGVLVGLPEARRRSTADIFERAGAPVVVIPAKVERPDLYYTIDGHWHAGGHAFVAKRVLEALLPLLAADR